MPRDYFKDVLIGVATGDALGVPVEFEERQALLANPVKGMREYGTYDLPAGTWSDDSSLTFCLAEALTVEYSLQNIGNNLVLWLTENYWTPRGSVFDVGIATRESILRIAKGVRPDLAGGFEISDNGNGALMRILPLIFYLHDKPINERFKIVKEVTSLTHGHIRSVMACYYYTEFARMLMQGVDKFETYRSLKTIITEFFSGLNINKEEVALFDRLLKDDISGFHVDEIKSTGYVIHTLEASLWCLLTSNSFEESVLKAVNLGDDSDTTGAVTGGLAGLEYGYKSIPEKWRILLARYKDIEDLSHRLKSRFDGV